MPLRYLDEWNFGGFPHQMPNEASSKFVSLMEMMAERLDDPQPVYEDFKTAFGNPNWSSNSSWALSNMYGSVGSPNDNAAGYEPGKRDGYIDAINASPFPPADWPVAKLSHRTELSMLPRRNAETAVSRWTMERRTPFGDAGADARVQ